ncbi:MAG: diguanylate cyclase, partial [bacterium]|nr:diguanylate cyclase [bacterium]
SAAIPAERLREEISKINFTTDNNTSFNITISLGISEYRKSDSKNEDIIDRADKALYRAKHMNKNQVVIYEKMDDLDTYDN